MKLEEYVKINLRKVFDDYQTELLKIIEQFKNKHPKNIITDIELWGSYHEYGCQVEIKSKKPIGTKGRYKKQTSWYPLEIAAPVFDIKKQIDENVFKRFKEDHPNAIIDSFTYMKNSAFVREDYKYLIIMYHEPSEQPLSKYVAEIGKDTNIIRIHDYNKYKDCIEDEIDA